MRDVNADQATQNFESFGLVWLYALTPSEASQNNAAALLRLKDEDGNEVWKLRMDDTGVHLWAVSLSETS